MSLSKDPSHHLACPAVPASDSDLPTLVGDTSSAEKNLPEPETEKPTGPQPGDELGHLNGGGPLSRWLSRSRNATSWIVPGPAPDGGGLAWLQVILAHVTLVSSWGMINSFGSLSPYYVTSLNESQSNINWIGSVQVSLLFLVGSMTGRATDAGYFHEVYLGGTILQFVGLLTLSFCKTYWQTFLAQGVCLGIANGLLFCPTLTLLSTYWLKRRAFAIGISAAGSSTGGLIFPSIVRELLPRIGFEWTIRLIAFLVLLMSVVCNLGLRTRLPPRSTGPLFEPSAFKEPSYLFFAMGMWLNFFALYFCFFNIGIYARDIGGFSAKDGASLLLILNGVGIPSRLIPNYIADTWTGPMNALIPSCTIGGIIMFCWAAVDSQAGLYVLVVMYGIWASCIQALFPATLTSLTTDPSKAGIRMGMIFSVVGTASLLGSPIFGLIIQHENGSYFGAQMLTGASLVLGSLVLVGSRISKTGWNLKVRM